MCMLVMVLAAMAVVMVVVVVVGKYVATWIFVSLECNSLCTRPVMLAAWIYLYNSGEGELCVHVGDGGGGGGSGDGGDVGGGRGQHSQHLCVAEV